jgi:hypothetical protein
LTSRCFLQGIASRAEVKNTFSSPFSEIHSLPAEDIAPSGTSRSQILVSVKTEMPSQSKRNLWRVNKVCHILTPRRQ